MIRYELQKVGPWGLLDEAGHVLFTGSKAECIEEAGRLAAAKNQATFQIAEVRDAWATKAEEQP